MEKSCDWTVGDYIDRVLAVGPIDAIGELNSEKQACESKMPDQEGYSPGQEFPIKIMYSINTQKESIETLRYDGGGMFSIRGQHGWTELGTYVKRRYHWHLQDKEFRDLCYQLENSNIPLWSYYLWVIEMDSGAIKPSIWFAKSKFNKAALSTDPQLRADARRYLEYIDRLTAENNINSYREGL